MLDLSYEAASAEDEGGVDIHHYDLFRLQKGANLAVLDMDHALHSSICLIEWPDRVDAHLIPTGRLELDIRILDNDDRSVTMTPFGDRWGARLDCSACASHISS